MTQPLFLRLALGFATLAGLAWLPGAASAVEINAVEIKEVFAFKGTATDIGVQRGPGQIGGIEYRVEGKFIYRGPLDLGKSTVTFHRLLDVTGGNGEMVLTTDNADLVCPVEDLDDCTLIDGVSLPSLHASSSSKPIEGKYESPARFRPQVRVQIKRKGDEFQFNVRLDRGLSPQVGPPEGNAAPDIAFPKEGQFPQGCVGDGNRKTTDIRTAFTIFDTANEVTVDFEKAWECSTPGRYHLRSR